MGPCGSAVPCAPKPKPRHRPLAIPVTIVGSVLGTAAPTADLLAGSNDRSTRASPRGCLGYCRHGTPAIEWPVGRK